MRQTLDKDQARSNVAASARKLNTRAQLQVPILKSPRPRTFRGHVQPLEHVRSSSQDLPDALDRADTSKLIGAAESALELESDLYPVAP